MKVYIKDEVIESMKTRFIPKGCMDVTDERSLMTAIEMMLHGANAFEIIQCKDCRHRYEEGDCTHYYWCRLNDRPIDDTDFCAWGERKGGEDE